MAMATDTERPAARIQLPFQVVTGGRLPVIRYQAMGGFGKVIPYDLPIEDGPYANPLGRRISDMLELFRLKESEIDDLNRRIDEMASAIAAKDKEITSLTHKLNEIKGRKESK